jgi:CubicO group peptidase (beta-lactamase class C family)
MPLHDRYLDNIAGDVRQLLRDAGVAQTSIWVEKFGSRQEQHSQKGTFHENEDARENDREDEGTTIYAIGSLTKLLIALLISIIVDKLSYSNEPEDEPYRKLRESYPDPWSTTFTILFNNFSDRKMSSLPKNPTLRHILLHFNSLPPMNSILLAPDGTSLMSIKGFLEVVPRLTEAARKAQEGDKIDYSNGNYILIGLLIQAIAPQNTLQTLMEKYIFRPLGMDRTFMNRSNLGDFPYARPHIVSTNGRRELIETPGYQASDIVNPAMAAYSCTRDIAILLRSFLGSLNRDESIFKRELVLRLLQPGGNLDKRGSDKQTLCGIHTTLDTSIPGSKSINRLITPTKVCSTYRLGVRVGKEVSRVPAYYMNGAVTGYASCFYFIPKHSTFVIVLTNTSGRIDASDHISRLIIQDIFDLERTLWRRAFMSTRLLDRNLELQKSDLRAKVDILDMSSRAAQEGQNLLREWERADAQGSIPSALPIRLDGTYYNELTHQSIIIRSHYDRLIVNITGDAGTSKDIGLHRTGDSTFRLYPLHPDGFVIDRYDRYSWNELSFKIEMEKSDDGTQRVVRIKRRVVLLPSTSIYVRMPESSGNQD